MKVKHYSNKNQRRQVRIRAKLTGTAVRPRISVDRSNKHLFAQLIDDTARKTLFGFSTAGLKDQKGTKTEQAALLGEAIAKKALDLKIKAAILDRGSYRYHGRIKALTESIRQNGLKI